MKATRLGIVVAFFAAISFASHAEQTLKEGGGKKWYRGNTHTHTLWSDGDIAPEMAVAWYAERDYDFLCISDHNILPTGDTWRPIGGESPLQPDHVTAIRQKFGEKWVEEKKIGATPYMRLKTIDELKKQFGKPGEFLLIQAEEITSGSPHVHVNGVNIVEFIEPSNGKTIAEAIRENIEAVEAQSRRLGIPMLAHLNHPNWSRGISAEDIIAAGAERFFEVYNGHAGVRNWGSERLGFPTTDRLWDIILAMRLSENSERPLLGLATDDSHNYHKFAVGEVNPGRGWIMVLCDELNANKLVEAIKRGEFYASAGVYLDEVKSTDKEISVKIKAEPGVTYKTQFIGTPRKFDKTSQPTLDKNGNPLANATRQYSKEIGQVLFETNANPAVYAINGNELYVRAKVISSELHPNPFAEGDHEMAWTQPVVISETPSN